MGSLASQHLAGSRPSSLPWPATPHEQPPRQPASTLVPLAFCLSSSRSSSRPQAPRCLPGPARAAAGSVAGQHLAREAEGIGPAGLAEVDGDLVLLVAQLAVGAVHEQVLDDLHVAAHRRPVQRGVVALRRRRAGGLGGCGVAPSLRSCGTHSWHCVQQATRVDDTLSQAGTQAGSCCAGKNSSAARLLLVQHYKPEGQWNAALQWREVRSVRL
jgi:hypothetical protein